MTITKAVERVVKACARELDALDADWAIGGAVAMAAHGYSRATSDVDLFVGDDVREELLAALAKKGVPVIATMEPIHYTIVPDTRHAEARVDLLFPALGIESLAMMAAARKRVFGVDLPVWPIAYVAAHKLTTDPRIDPDRAIKDEADLRELRARGLIDPGRVLELLDAIRDRAAKRRLSGLVRAAKGGSR